MTQWKLVPVEPTRAMLVAAHMIERDDVELTEDEHRAMYEAFLSAAPSPAGDEDEVERVARAIQDAHAPGHALSHVSLYQARAAISAMRPAPKLTEAG